MTAEERVQRHRRVLEGLLGLPATEGNEITVLRNGVEIFPAMLEAIRSARQTVDLLTYVYWTGDVADEFAGALCDRGRAGVRVRVLLDAVGAARMNRELIDKLEEAGCDVRWFRPPTTWKVWELDHRTHRKVLICDEEVAFTGGVGIAEEWEGDARHPGEWRDTHVRVRGPAVDGLRGAFVNDWFETGAPLLDERDRFPEQQQCGDSVVQVVRSPAQVGWSDLGTVYSALITMAQERLRITSAYFVPEQHFVDGLVGAARRGVEVEVLVPGEHVDKRVVQVAGEADYEPLLEAGVRIHRYGPTMLHAKVITVDGIVACLGSGNFDPRSLRRNDEANLIVFDPEVVGVLDRHFDEDVKVSEAVRPGSWQRRSVVQRAAEAATRVLHREL